LLAHCLFINGAIKIHVFPDMMNDRD